MSAASSDEHGQAETRRYVEELVRNTGWQPKSAATFAGALSYTKYGWLTRLVMKLIARAAHHATDTSRDHEYTDWNQVDRFALEFLTRLEPDQTLAPHAAGP